MQLRNAFSEQKLLSIFIIEATSLWIMTHTSFPPSCYFSCHIAIS